MSRVSTIELIEQLREEESGYLEVLSEDSMSVELATYPNPEPKYPHTEDELYYIISGSGTARVGGETYRIEEGDVLFVEQGLEHDFFDIEEEITALTVFAGPSDPSVVRDR
jgi:mannose-1-phosphate guanylyltransferase